MFNGVWFQFQFVRLKRRGPWWNNTIVYLVWTYRFAIVIAHYVYTNMVHTHARTHAPKHARM